MPRGGQGGPPSRYFFASGESCVQVRHAALAAAACAYEDEVKSDQGRERERVPYVEVPECSKSYEEKSARQAQMHFFGELDGHAIPLDPNPLVGGQDLGPKPRGWY